MIDGVTVRGAIWRKGIFEIGWRRDRVILEAIGRQLGSWAKCKRRAARGAGSAWFLVHGSEGDRAVGEEGMKNGEGGRDGGSSLSLLTV